MSKAYLSDSKHLLFENGKELHSETYRNYNFKIFGKYTSDYGIKFEGKWHIGGVQLNIYVNGDYICKTLAFTGHALYGLSYDSDFIIKNRFIYQPKFFGLYNKIVGIHSIQDDYKIVMEESILQVRKYIDGELDVINKILSDQEITDGLPDSIGL